MITQRVYRSRWRRMLRGTAIGGLVLVCVLAGAGFVLLVWGFALLGGWR